MNSTPDKKVCVDQNATSPDIFEGTVSYYTSPEDSFDLVDGGIGRKRSEAIELTLISESDTTLRENSGPILEEEEDDEEQENADDTIMRLLNEASDDEMRDDPDAQLLNEGSMFDALTNVLASFKNGPSCDDSENVTVQPSTSKNTADESGNRNKLNSIHGSYNGKDNNFSQKRHLLPFSLPFASTSQPDPDESPTKKKMITNDDDDIDIIDCLPSTSSENNGLVDEVISDVGGYWNQKKTIEINGHVYEIDSYADYMRMKIDKLNRQVNTENTKPVDRISNIFEGYSVFVNGFTDPPALVIRDLMFSHGGEYHCYYMHGKTSYIIATSIANAKVNRLREKEIYIRVDWITESIAAGKALEYKDYLIYEKGANEKGNMQKFLANNDPATSMNMTKPTNEFLDARDPNFIKNYYARSRLHLISTLAQNMKDFVANLKESGPMAEQIIDEQQLIMLGNPMEENRNKNTERSIWDRIIFHVDLDCFFVSVALRTKENLINSPVAISHSKGTTSNSMSEIASCSYAARKCGVRNGMLVKHAIQLCPQLVLLPYQFDEYIDVSKQIYKILASFTLEIRAVSCDEMYLNVTSMCEKYKISDPRRLAEYFREIIRKNTGCPASVGIGPTSLLARLATRHAKPDGTYYVSKEDIYKFMMNERIEDLPGLGYQMMDRVNSFLGPITTCGQLQSKSEHELTRVFGPKSATKIFKQCRGEELDSDDFWQVQSRKSVSCDINYGIRFQKKEELIQLVKAIGYELERKLTDCRMITSSITLKLMVRSANAPRETAKFMGHGRCDTYTKTTNIGSSTNHSDIISNEILKLYYKISPVLEDLRGIGVTCGKLKSKTRKNVVDAVQEMFGKTKKTTISNEKETLENHVENDEEMEMKKMNAENAIAQHLNSKEISEATKLLNVPDPIDLIAGEGVIVPEILRKTNSEMKKAFRGLELNGIHYTDLTELENAFLEICKNEPTKPEITKIYKLFSSLLKTGNLCTLDEITNLFKDICKNSSKSHCSWFDTSCIMMNKLTKESNSLLEFPINFLSSNQSSSGDKNNKNPISPEEEKLFILKNGHLMIREVNICDTTGINS